MKIVKQISPEIESKKKALEEAKKSARRAARELADARKIVNRGDRIRVAIVGNFLRKKCPEEYEKIIEREEFNQYLNRDGDRKLFGFTPLLAPGPEENEEEDGDKKPAPSEDIFKSLNV